MEQKTTRIAFLKIGDAAKESDARQHAHHDSADFFSGAQIQRSRRRLVNIHGKYCEHELGQ